MKLKKKKKKNRDPRKKHNEIRITYVMILDCLNTVQYE